MKEAMLNVAGVLVVTSAAETVASILGMSKQTAVDMIEKSRAGGRAQLVGSQPLQIMPSQSQQVAVAPAPAGATTGKQPVSGASGAPSSSGATPPYPLFPKTT